jgi:hypothetical protein
MTAFELGAYRRNLEHALSLPELPAGYRASSYSASLTRCWPNMPSASARTPMRDHDVRGLTAGELERARRELAASLTLARPDSPIRAPIMAHISAIDTELAERVRCADG